MNNDISLWMYRKMVTSRRYEEAIFAAYLEGKSPIFNVALGPIPGEMHLSNGQEPCAVGTCAHLGPEDFVTSTHRPHHVAIAKEVDLPAMTAEIFGKVEGLSGGRGGHMHLFDPKVNFCCSGICGEGIGSAVGAALAFKMRGEPHVATAFTGEGAANQGIFHESLNLAALWNLPYILVIEDNRYGVSVSKKASTSVPTNDVRAAAYGIPGVHVAGNDPFAIYDAMGEAVARARQGQGPSIIEIETSRLAGHFAGDPQDYRPKGELAEEQGADPIPAMRARLLNEGIADVATLNSLEAEAEADVEDAMTYARNGKRPDIDDAYSCVFV
ncbi:MAG: thiamine pyrophosphate-dependent dehydrogenase E1 component subunit alpha [Parasphingopyxis sp.]|uniref:thiamine pyrophosphate-dependent dehydrogenase E1 component subunit alpha n=1 Tax=Parasphingopyxis sp. TaxID=1920299 RepID=UPI0032ED3580